jgi:2-polyprenyl-3-methyl-5-hydroxy-6-metoxy-1,4-benzoquinol methylase
MKQNAEPREPSRKRQYDVNYGNFQDDVYAQIRREAFGEDIGQNSWLTADEQDKFLSWLGLSAGKTLLDVACGAGGPVLRAAEVSGCGVVGVDVHAQGIATAKSLASQKGLSGVAEFLAVDATQKLPFPDGKFDAITCIDAINHFPGRLAVLQDWARVLKPGGRMLFTDPITVTGALTNAEIAIRSSTSFYLFVPLGYDERLLTQCGLKLLVTEDRTGNMAKIAERRRAARASRSEVLRGIEGGPGFEEQQEFLAVTARVAGENRLSRFVYVAERV